MKIVELDGFAANPGDISIKPWQEIECPDGTLCEYIKYDRTSPGEIVDRCMDADICITNKVVFTAEIMDQLPMLKYIGVLATGYNVVDCKAARDRGVIVTNIPAYSTQSVGQLAIAHLLHIANNVAIHDKAVHEGKWSNNPDFTFMETPQMELAGRIFGVIGLGNTGSATARIADALGMKVVAFTSKPQGKLPQYIRKAESLNALFKEADVLSLHCPLTPETKHIINKEHLALMKPTAIVLNTGRGPLVDDQALADSLNEGRLYAAGIDVMTQEPPCDGSPLLTAKNCHITPHIAWATFEARQRLYAISINNVKAFLAGKPQNVVN